MSTATKPPSQRSFDASVLMEGVAQLRQLYPSHSFPLESQVWAQVGHHRDLYRVLVLFGLSPRTSNHRLVQVCNSFFARYPSREGLLRSPPGDQELVELGLVKGAWRRSIGSLVTLLKQYDGTIPRQPEELKAFVGQVHGCGEKVQECVVGYGLGMPAIPVDVTVCRVVGRISGNGWEGGAPGDASRIRDRLKYMSQVHPDRLKVLHLAPIDLHELLWLHGRVVCRPRPLCHQCPVSCCISRREAYSSASKGVRQAALEDMGHWQEWRDLLLAPRSAGSVTLDQ